MRISDWSSDVCSSDLATPLVVPCLSGQTAAGVMLGFAVPARHGGPQGPSPLSRPRTAGGFSPDDGPADPPSQQPRRRPRTTLHRGGLRPRHPPPPAHIDPHHQHTSPPHETLPHT